MGCGLETVQLSNVSSPHCPTCHTVVDNVVYVELLECFCGGDVCGCVCVSRAAAKIEIRVLEQIRDVIDDGQK